MYHGIVGSTRRGNLSKVLKMSLSVFSDRFKAVKRDIRVSLLTLIKLFVFYG